MKNSFIHDNFFLQSQLAEDLYHNMAKCLPVIDFHNHLNPVDLAENRKFNNLTDAWVAHDPYKHRAMRICGVPENNITGSVPHEVKFNNWAETLPKTIGNPLYLWSALELKRVFGIEEPLTKDNSAELYNYCNKKLKEEGFGAADILKKFNPETVCTSDDLLDDISVHQRAGQKHGFRVLPSLRGDSMLNADQPTFMPWLAKLQDQSIQKIKTLDDFKNAILAMLDRFSAAGCCLADHALDSGFQFAKANVTEAAVFFENLLNGKQLHKNELAGFKTHMFVFLASEYARRKWTLQLHIGAHRFTSSRLRRLSGPVGGYATIGNTCDISGLCGFLDQLEKADALPRVILYTLNPADNEAFATLTGSFAEDGKPGKIQFGPAWWYNDHYEGMRQQFTALASYGLLSLSAGMTTDSRSVFSFSRHEYFRRVLCNLIAEWVSAGNLPNDYKILSRLISDISYYNSKNQLFNI